MTRRSDRPAGRPRRRTKDRAGKSGRGYLIAGAAVGAVALVVLVLVAGLLLPQRRGPEETTTPEQYVVYNAPEDVLHVSMPKGWQLQSGGRKSAYWVSAEKGGATIKVYESLTGSLLGDIAGAGQADPNVSDELLPVSRVHNMKQKAFPEEDSNY